MQDRAKEILFTAASSSYRLLSNVPSLFSRTQTVNSPPTLTPSIPKSKTGRKRSDFKNNVTASLALPDTPKKISSCQQKSEASFFSSVITSVTSIFSNTPAATKPQITQTNIGIATEIANLEKQVQQLTDDEIKTKLDDLLLQEVNLLEHEIREHAKRRVDLFFYLLLAVYNTGVIVSKDKTTKQHGKGNKTLNTQGCHSSLFPAVKFTQPTPYLSFLAVKPITLENTFFEEVLNMTVELPAIVNAFDGHLEGRSEQTRYVDACLDILNLAAKGTIDPITAMNQFFLKMNAFFQRFKEKYLDKGKSNTLKTNQKIWEYEREGTFEAANPDFTLKYEYLYMMLRLNPHEIRASYIPGLDKQVLTHNYRLIQEELLSTKIKPTAKTAQFKK